MKDLNEIKKIENDFDKTTKKIVGKSKYQRYFHHKDNTQDRPMFEYQSLGSQRYGCNSPVLGISKSQNFDFS